MHNSLLERLQRYHVLEAVDVHFARFLGELDGGSDPDLVLAAALTSRATGAGDIYLDLRTVEDSVLLTAEAGRTDVVCPKLRDWEQRLHSSSVVGRAGESCPLILDEHHRLYLYRYWQYEKDLSAFILQRVRSNRRAGRVDPDWLREGLAGVFPAPGKEGVNWQKVAALVALTKPFCVISGGPGTGKTSTVAGIVSLLRARHPAGKPRIYLAAPTGKAAARLGEALQSARTALGVPETVGEPVPAAAVTIHRMLRSIPGTSTFRHNASNPVAADAVIIDEASMVDLALMARLVQALEDDTQLILIGDKDQLASVQAGAVLGDVCDRSRHHGYSHELCRMAADIAGEDIGAMDGTGGRGAGLRDCIVELRHSYRFAPGGGIGALSRRVNQGDADRVLALLQNGSEPSVRWKSTASVAETHRQLAGAISTQAGEYRKFREPQKALTVFNRLGILCAVNQGACGVDAVNRLVEQLLAADGRIVPARAGGDPWYAGRPVMITRNDYHLGLFNGDVGMAMPGSDPKDPQQLLVYFQDPGNKGLRQIPTYRLSDHQTAYTMTVHKSQGSEFDTVHLVLPEQDSPVLSRELIYTAVTRARKEVVVWGPENVLTAAVRRKIERSSGLRDTLWGKDA